MKVRTLIAGAAVMLLCGGLGVCVAEEAPTPAPLATPEAAPSSAPKHHRKHHLPSIMPQKSSANRSCRSIWPTPRVSERA
jgi:hypothetical protein